LVTDLDVLEKDLHDKKKGCSRVCRSMLLGDLIQATEKCGLYPGPSATFGGLAVHQVIYFLKHAPSSNCFSSLEDSVESKCSDHWCRAIPARRQQGFSGFLSASEMVPQPNVAINNKYLILAITVTAHPSLWQLTNTVWFCGRRKG
jgi:hypothetical protein